MAMQARISTIEGDAGKIDDAVKIINEKILPALDGSAEAVKPMRTEVAEAMNGKVVGFESYELVAQSW